MWAALVNTYIHGVVMCKSLVQTYGAAGANCFTQYVNL